MTKIDAAALCSDWLDLDTEVTSTFAKSDRDRRVRSSAEFDSMGEAADRVAPPAQVTAAVSMISCRVQVLLDTSFGIPRYSLMNVAENSADCHPRAQLPMTVHAATACRT